MRVSKAQSSGSGGPFGVRVGGGVDNGQRPAAGTTFSRDTLLSRSLGALNSSSVSSIAKQRGVAAAGGALVVTDLSVSGTIPSASSGGGGFGGGGAASNFHTHSVTVPRAAP